MLLHGWGMDSRIWGDFAEALSAHFSLFIIDLPGLGQSKNVPDPYTAERVAEALSEPVSAIVEGVKVALEQKLKKIRLKFALAKTWSFLAT